MKKYANISGKSNISEYLDAETSIKIKFRNSGTIYVYSHSVTGPEHVDAMIRLAISGSGLNSYIANRKKTLKFTKEF